MVLTAPYFSNTFDRVRSMQTVDLADMYNRSVIELGNSLLPQSEPEEVEDSRMPDPYAPKNSDISESLPQFQRMDNTPILLRRTAKAAPTSSVAPADKATVPLAKDLTSFVKEFEGFSPRAFSDYKQVSIGYGTRAKPGEKMISRQEAERRLASELAASRSRVESHAQQHGYQFSQKQLDALTSFDYNTGRLEQLTAKGTRTPEVIAERMLQYNKAGGKVLPGLERRRKAEHQLFQTP